MPYAAGTRQAFETEEGSDRCQSEPSIAVRASDGAHVLRLRALGALRDVELDLLVLVEGLVAL